ncbi:SDR family oxidoreductase [Paenibacillus marinisediminis]
MNLFDLRGKNAVLLGGGSTLGQAIAEGLAAHGARLAIVGRNEEKTSAVVRQLSEQGADAAAFYADVTHDGDLQRLHAELMMWADHIDVLLHLPGVNSATPFFDITSEEWDHIMNVNAKSAFRTAQLFGKTMTESGRGGSIIFISSVSSDPPLSKVFTYSASKAVINNMTKFLAKEFAPSGVRVNAIIPGFFPAEQNRAILAPERVEAIMRHTPMQRFGSPKELQGAAVWLASEAASSFVTGTLIRVDGGFGAMTI